MRVTIFDYGAGNIHSLAKALRTGAADVVTADDPVCALDTDVLVLPGVGNFGAAAARVAAGRREMRDAILAGLPTIGICLGMQLLFDESDEAPGPGLGVIAGRVTRLRAARVPQIGWNRVEWEGGAPSMAYYANSYVCRPERASVVAWSEYEGDRFPAAVRAANCLGVQFHPEKSSWDGVRLLRRFVQAGEIA